MRVSQVGATLEVEPGSEMMIRTVTFFSLRHVPVRPSMSHAPKQSSTQPFKLPRNQATRVKEKELKVKGTGSRYYAEGNIIGEGRCR